MNITLSLEEIKEIIYKDLKEKFETTFYLEKFSIEDNSCIKCSMSFYDKEEPILKSRLENISNTDLIGWVEPDFTDYPFQEELKDYLKRILYLLVNNHNKQYLKEIYKLYCLAPEIIKKTLLETYDFQVFLHANNLE